MTETSPDALVLENVAFGFVNRPDFLGPCSLTVSPGECWAIVGPNGAGKTTLLRLMAGLLRPSGGSVRLGNHSLSAMPARRRAKRIAYLPQRVLVDLDFTVGELVLMGRFPHRSLGLFESAADREIAARAMETTGITEFADRTMGTLSGGEAQRVHIAASLAQEPDVLLLDEPTASLDLQHQLTVHHILKDLAENARMAVVVVTHDINLAAQMCSRALVLDQGKTVASGEPSAVLTPDVLNPVYSIHLESLTGRGDEATRWLVPVGSSEVCKP